MNFLGVNALKESYGSALEVVCVPSNVFGLQEPGRDDELLNGYEHVRPGDGFRPNFHFSSKLDVNGANEAPIYTFLKGKCDRTDSLFGPPSSMYWSPVRASDLTWNFEKFLIDQQGKPYKRYGPGYLPTNMAADIAALLATENETAPAGETP